MNKYLLKLAEMTGESLPKLKPLKKPKVLDPPSYKDTMPTSPKPAEAASPPKIKPIE